MSATRSGRPSVGEGHTDFGFSRVPLDSKQALVDDVFHAVADRYDLMNDLMSAGLHREWKNVFVGMARPARNRPWRHIDVAGGTGDISFRIAALNNANVHSTVVDINGAMLAVCKDRAERLGYADRVDTVEANAERLPFPDGYFDLCTIAFGIRNVPRIQVALEEARRVLKKGGRFLCLEFSKVDLPIVERIYDQYSFRVVPKLGEIVTGEAQPYRYLAESIRKFPAPDEFRDMIAAAGFKRAAFELLTGGVVAIHSGWNL
ncbi:MAG: bifunctional demethylmenaquinone methyltransferase/2-methoxy-6-polyprenyl-1,4-benzoquinol methylase UbiE [Hyphomicrobiales bacterium]|nr:bifunctional demethylmenaquinone methyltransferase/2-methoxy-6-polyprenyl-1,4-benzoquinol methylase UbiE [Hyphomicrobiales bacterium]